MFDFSIEGAELKASAFLTNGFLLRPRPASCWSYDLYKIISG